jgi:hypothetical protein
MQGALDTPIRYRRVMWNLCVDEDATEVGVLLALVDDDETLLLVSQRTWELLSSNERLGDFFGWAVAPSHGEHELPAWMLTPHLGSYVAAEGSLAGRWVHEVQDYARHIQDADPDVDYCVAAPSCLQDVIHRDRGFPICAFHDAQMGEVEALLIG